jgi:integrase
VEWSGAPLGSEGGVMNRERVAEGIHRDQYGYDVRVKAKGVPRTKRFPDTGDVDADLAAMQLWQARTRAELLDRAADAEGPSERGTLAEAAPKYLARIAGRAGAKADGSHLAAWVTLYGSWQLTRVQRATQQVDLAIALWRSEGYSDKTILHRCRVLRELIHTLLGKAARHPITDAKTPKTPKPNPVEVPIATIRKVAKKLLAANKPQEYARFQVLVTTGQRPCQVMRAIALDVNLKKKTWIVRSAKNEPAHVVYLNADMLAAWRLFILANAWGTYDTSEQAKLLRACGWPEGIRPYNARHSLAFAALERGADLGDVQGLLGHTQIQTTRNTYGPLQAKRQRRVSELVAGRFGRR